MARAVSPPPDGGYSGFNTAEGDKALFSMTSMTTGQNNTAIGFDALYSDTTGNDNTATGHSALVNNISGNNNTAYGAFTLVLNTGNDNTAIGYVALYKNTTGFNNTAAGEFALQNNSTGYNNAANGVSALSSNTTGNNNTANGEEALFRNTTGFNNTALGVSAGSNLTTGNNNIDIGNAGVAGESNRIRIGKVGTQQATFIAGISGKTVPGGVTVVVGANGHLGTIVSSERFKEAIKPMEQASEAILALKPITFRYKHELDPEGIPQFGLVAEQVEKVNPDLVARDEQGKVYTVRYEAVNAMLLNEFLKEHRKVQQLETTVVQQQKDFQATVAQQQKQIEALSAGLHKVSDTIQLDKKRPQLVASGQ